MNNYVTWLTTVDEVRAYHDYVATTHPESVNIAGKIFWIAQYLNSHKLPAYVGFLDSHSTHQNINKNNFRVTSRYAIYNSYYKNAKDVPLKALLHPAAYPEYFI